MLYTLYIKLTYIELLLTANEILRMSTQMVTTS